MQRTQSESMQITMEFHGQVKSYLNNSTYREPA